jgi:transcriptional regulator with GAF, ATPase, and Fis domain
MNDDRERKVTEAFVSIANSLVGEFDVIDLLNGLTTNCAELLDIASAGLLLADERTTLHVVAASSEATRTLELFQLQRDQGPCLDCYRRGEPVSVSDVEDHRLRWPQFVDAAEGAGFVSVHAVPMRLPNTVLGTLGLFGTRAGKLGESDINLAQALAHVASIAIVRGGALVGDAAVINEKLNATLGSRAAVEQAKGLLAQRGELTMEQAFAVLRDYAHEHNLHLGDAATQLLTHKLSTAQVLEYSRSRKSH